MMSRQASVQAQTAVKPTITPTATGVLQRQCACGQHTSAGGECKECKKKREGILQRAAINQSPVHDVPPIVHEVLRSPGQPLGAATRAFMEPRFGQDFSAVRVHTDAQAAESTQAVNALAYTVGTQLVFGRGQYAPETSKGRQTLAHELTHVIQQHASDSHMALTLSHLDRAYEQQADAIAAAIDSEPLPDSTIRRVYPPGVIIQRQGDGGESASQGSGEGTVTILPETTIVATQPASLRSAIGTMDYYVERASDFAFRNPGDTPPDYYFLYGNKYVNRFKTILRPSLSPSGKAWLDCTLNALQTAIEDRRDANPWAFAELELDNDKFQAFAYDTHSRAYSSCGVCDISIVDEAKIALTPDFKDLLTLGGVEQIIDTFLQCQVAWFYPQGPAR
jgi:hypothetical protein